MRALRFRHAFRFTDDDLRGRSSLGPITARPPSVYLRKCRLLLAPCRVRDDILSDAQFLYLDDDAEWACNDSARYFAAFSRHAAAKVLFRLMMRLVRIL